MASLRAARRRLRLAGGDTHVVTLPRRAVLRLRRAPAALVLVGALAGLIGAGTAGLLLPPATRSGEETSLLTALFTATSAACTTGLIVVDTADHWTLLGPEYGISKLTPPAGYAGRTVRDLALGERFKVALLAIERAAQVIINPGPEERIAATDLLVVAGADDDVERVR